jgi:hypothetical protein
METPQGSHWLAHFTDNPYLRKFDSGRRSKIKTTPND